MMTKAEAIKDVVMAVHAAGLVVCSSSMCDPPPIRSGDPIHAAVVRLEKQFPNAMLPTKGRSRWKRVLRFSRSRDSRLYEAVDDFLDWLHDNIESNRSDASEGEQADGPCQRGFTFRWLGVAFELTPQVWRVIVYFWNRTIASQDDFEDAIWGECTDAVAVRKAIHRTNEALAEAGVPWRLRLKNAHVQKESTVRKCDQFVTA